MKCHQVEVSVACMLVTTLYLLSSAAVDGSSVVKRRFVALGCMGQYDTAALATLDRVCENCYELYRRAGLHSLCSSYCFKNEIFDECVKVLQMEDQQTELRRKVDQLFGI